MYTLQTVAAKDKQIAGKDQEIRDLTTVGRYAGRSRTAAAPPYQIYKPWPTALTCINAPTTERR
jgi:hypothetical protein